jgi:hypothetical protein
MRPTRKAGRPLLLLPWTLSLLAGCASGREASGASAQDQVGTGSVAFRVPLLDANDGTLLSKHNSDLEAHGLETFPDTVDVTPRTLEESWEKWHGVVAAANAKLGTKLELEWNANPAQYGAALCYIGDPRAVPKTMRELNDSVFAEFITVYRWKYKTESHLGDAWESFGEPEDPSKYPAAFHAFTGDGTGEDVMLAVTVNDDGYDGEFFAIRIPRCA